MCRRTPQGRQDLHGGGRGRQGQGRENHRVSLFSKRGKARGACLAARHHGSGKEKNWLGARGRHFALRAVAPWYTSRAHTNIGHTPTSSPHPHSITLCLVLLLTLPRPYRLHSL